MYYVYQLIDPRNNLPFYIGKGTKNRIHDHESPKSLLKNSKKNKTILAIKESGLQVKKEIVKTFVSEDAAYRFEAKLIKQIGRKNLTNMTDGGAGAPSWVVADEQIAKDKAMAEIIFLFIRKTGAFKYPVKFYIAGHLTDMGIDRSEQLYKALKSKLYKLLKERGHDWLAKIGKQSGVLLVPSKIEGFRHG